MDMEEHVKDAVRFFWETRERQAGKQKKADNRDQGMRSAVTGGTQMDGFVTMLSLLIQSSGIPEDCIFTKKRFLELPGFFRPTKEWDILVVQEQTLLVAIELKSQVGPSFGNNFNNRTEEAMGSALDLWTAFRENAFNRPVRPWLGYLFLLEDCPKSQKPVKVREPHFKVLPEFREASYMQRYELFCKKLVLERHYDSTVLITSTRQAGIKGQYQEPCCDIGFDFFVKKLSAYLKGAAI